MKNKTFSMRISEKTLQELEFLAKELNMSKSEVVSKLIESCSKAKKRDIRAFNWLFEG